MLLFTIDADLLFHMALLIYICCKNAGVRMELVDKFRYLGDMLSVEGDADAAVETRIRIGWNKFGQLVPLLTNKDISLTARGRLYRVVCEAVCCMEVRPGL